MYGDSVQMFLLVSLLVVHWVVNIWDMNSGGQHPAAVLAAAF